MINLDNLIDFRLSNKRYATMANNSRDSRATSMIANSR